MSTFENAIDPSVSTPPYRQLHDAVVAAVASGELPPGSKLPTVRGLAAQLEVAPNTVASAYRALEESGLIEGRGRAGTFVSLASDPVEAAARRVALEAAAALGALGVSRERALELLHDAYAA